MSSRQSSWLPLALMATGLVLVIVAISWAVLNRKQERPVALPEKPEAAITVAVQYRPLDADWWLVFDTSQPALTARIRQQLSAFDPATPNLPAGYPEPQAMAAAGALRLWQFASSDPTPLPATPSPSAENGSVTGRWHREALADATVLFWLPAATETTAIDRVQLAAAGTGMLHRRWLQQRLGWVSASCDPLPTLLQALPEQAQLHFSEPAGDAHGSVHWQLLWPQLPAELAQSLLQLGAPKADGGDADRWFWREANLAALSRASDCPPPPPGAGFVARLWQAQSRWHAALARPGASSVQGFPVPLPSELNLRARPLANGQALSSDEHADGWLQQQPFHTDSGLLLAIEHHGDGDFAGMSLQLRASPPALLQLQWSWPLP